MDHRDQLEYEARVGRRAALAAFGSALLILVSGFYLTVALRDRPDDSADFLLAVDREPTDFVVAGILQGVATLLLGVVLVFLYRAAKHRRPELPRAALVLAVAAPLVMATVGVARQVELIDVARDFAATSPVTEENVARRLPEAPARARRDAVESSDDRAEDGIREGGNLAAIAGVGFAGNLALAFAVVMINLYAMRAGLVSRFLGIVGIIIGVLVALPGIVGTLPVVQLFWLVAVGVLFLGRWPGGRGPAWETGEAIPWPSAAEQRAALEASREREEGRPPAEPDDAQTSNGGPAGGSPHPASAKRKRKRRR